jgi:predicted dehydrogenase
MMKNKTIKFALIGCGAIAHKHVAAVNGLENGEIVGAYDVNQEAGQVFSKKYAIPVFSDVDKLVEATRPDVFNILTPSGFHAENILDLIRFNKHFVVEKPLALDLESVDQILEACHAGGLKVFVVKQNRFNPPIVKLKEAIDSGRFGKLVLGTVRVRWCRTQEYYDSKPWRGTRSIDGGVFANQALHHIDMLAWMMGDVSRIMAMSSAQLVNIEAEDTGAAIFHFNNGALGIIEATMASRPKDLEGSISILGEKGAVEIGGFFMNELKTWNFSEPMAEDKDVWGKFSRVPDGYAWSHTEMYKDIIKCLTLGTESIIVGAEGRLSIKLVNAICLSASNSEEVFFDDLSTDASV